MNYKIFNKNMLCWTEISYLINNHQRILNTPLIAPLLIEQNKEVYDDGQAEYFLPGGDRQVWMKGFFRPDPRVSDQLTKFFEDIKAKVDNKEYDLIMLQPSLLPMGVGAEIKKYYKFDGELLVVAPQDRRPYAVTVWRPL